jgi:glycerol-3-phosphate dehydrogenase
MPRSLPPDTSFDVLIIGAGINGAGIARDAAMRGLSVLLLDKGDICSGTSSWSSRLIHGGVRYLEHGELSLVHESLIERETLLRIAPHLIRPLSMLLPIYQGAKRGTWMIRAGMIAYDLLSVKKSLPRHRMLSRAAALKRAPELEPRGLVGAALYYDAQVEFAERLVVENVLAAREHGATVTTYARIDRLVAENNVVRGVEFTDLLAGEACAVRASVTLNVAGPWVDRVLAGAGDATKPLIGGTKGSHLIVDRFAGAPVDGLYVEAREDGRPFFILPWNHKILIGTTDLPYHGDLDRVEATDDEIAYLLREANRVLPSAALTRESVLYTHAGVRPLPFVDQSSPGGITRRHFLHDHSPALRNFFSIVGGKLTTYRNLSQQVVDLLFKQLGREPIPCRTAETALPGAMTENFAAYSEAFRKNEASVPATIVNRLLRIYGTRAPEVIKLADADAELGRSFDVETGAIGAEIVFAFRNEMAETLVDCLLRRTMVGLNSNAGLEAVEAAADIARRYLDWPDDRAASEVFKYREYVKRFHPSSAGNLQPG